MTSPLQALLALQEQDLAIDQLRYRRGALPERSQLTATIDEAKQLIPKQGELRTRRDEVVREEQRLEHEIASLRERARDAEAKLFSGAVASPRELQALQADVDQLKQQASRLEDDELECMGRRESLEGELDPLEARLGELRAAVDLLQRAIETAEHEIDAEIEQAIAERATRAGVIDAALLADYETRRARNRGHGAAQLVGDTCQACRLSIPATEVDEIRHDDSGKIWYCDNCGAILVAS
jgi:predicted  nucleic acid-binding Zn-ribbon protein